ncbi:MAG TPA: phage holin family protein [Chthoniobacter sp.]|jgi:uncharacterized membrane protein YqjE
MPASTTDDPRQTGGLFAHLSTLIAAKLAYLKARLELAGIEGREAAIHLAIILALAIGGLILVVFGYFFFVLAIVFLIAMAFGSGSWIYVLLGAALVHFVGAVVLVLLAWVKLRVPLFPLSLEEFKKDQEWLKQNANTN